MPKRLTHKQLMAGFGGKRRQSAALHGGLSKRAVKRSKSVKKRSTTTHKTTSRKKKTTSSTSGIPTAVKLAIGAVLVLGGVALENWVIAHGGWPAVYQAWKAGGPMGLLSWAQNASRVNQPDLGLVQSGSANAPGKITQPGLGGSTGSYGPGAGGGAAGGGGPPEAFIGPPAYGELPSNQGNNFDSTVYGDPQDTVTQDLIASGGVIQAGNYVIGLGGNDVHYFDENGNLIA